MLAAKNYLLLRRIPSHGLIMTAIVSTTMGGTPAESNRLLKVWIPCPRGTRGIPKAYTSRQDYCNLFRQNYHRVHYPSRSSFPTLRDRNSTWSSKVPPPKMGSHIYRSFLVEGSEDYSPLRQEILSTVALTQVPLLQCHSSINSLRRSRWVEEMEKSL